MKKAFGFILVIGLMLICSVALADTQSGLFTYKLKGNGTAVITGFDWDASGNNDVYVPRMIDGYTVTEIGSCAFSRDDDSLGYFKSSVGKPFYRKGMGNPVTIVLPDSITVIGEKAFYCTDILACNIPASVQIIGAGAFAGCTNITQFSVDRNNATYTTIDGVLYNKNQKALVAAPAGYSSDTSDNKFIVPEGIKEIGDYAFYGMTLRAWTEDDSKDDSFIGIQIASTVERIGKYAFAYLYARINDTRVRNSIYFFNVKTIDDYAFYYAHVNGYNWENSKIESIGKYSFAYTNLTSSYDYDGKNPFPSSLMTIDEYSFYHSKSSKELDLSRTTIDCIPAFSFSNFEAYNSIILPMKLKSIEQSAFANSDIERGYISTPLFQIPETVETIGNNAFYGSNLEGGIIIPDNSRLRIIGNSAFDEVSFSSIDEIVLPIGLQSIGNRAFFSTGIKTLSIPKSVNYIGEAVCDRSITKLRVDSNSYAALYASENGYPTVSSEGEDTSWLNN